jgi:hypothetical protein
MIEMVTSANKPDATSDLADHLRLAEPPTEQAQ